MQLKSYTDVEQSKKLAEILPIESADCFWDYDEMQKFHRINWFEEGFGKESQLILNKNNICAWSLAALLRLMPKRYNDGGVYMPLVGRYYEGNHTFICGYFGDGLLVCAFGKTSIDACYEMILKLHELKML